GLAAPSGAGVARGEQASNAALMQAASGADLMARASSGPFRIHQWRRVAPLAGATPAAAGMTDPPPAELNGAGGGSEVHAHAHPRDARIVVEAVVVARSGADVGGVH